MVCVSWDKKAAFAFVLTAPSVPFTDAFMKITKQQSKPKQWQMSDGEVAEVHTPFSTRAKELMELFHGELESFIFIPTASAILPELIPWS